MKKSFIHILCAAAVAVIAAGCAPKALTEETLFYNTDDATIQELTKDGKLYTLKEFKDKYMTEKGNYNLPELYRSRGVVDANTLLFSIDTLPAGGEGIYIRGRVTTDDYGGNYYKALVIQQIVDGKQQNLRISVDIGSVGGLYQIGQEVLIRCNGLAIGRYSNQPQLCAPSYNNNTNAGKATEKIGWNPGRISAAAFNKAVKKIGKPDRSLLVYEEMTLQELDSRYLSNYANIKGCRDYDGLLVRIRNVHFTGQYHNQGKLVMCNQYTYSSDAAKQSTTGHPEYDEYSNVLAPTTKAQGFPQSRIVADASESYTVLIGCSEYAKFARVYIPSIISNKYSEFDYAAVTGDIEGILGYYIDNGPNLSKYSTELSKYKFSITPRDLGDFHLYENGDKSKPWTAKEFAVENFK